MLNSEGKNRMDMLIIQAVEDIAAILPVAHQAPGSEEFQLLTDRGLLHPQLFAD